MPLLLEVRNASRRHPQEPRWLLDHVSLSVRAGERLALAGPSGAGKTLLLRAMAQLDPLDEGAVYWHERPVRSADMPGFRRSAIYLHQRAVLLGDRSFGDTVEGALRQPFSLAVHRKQSFNQSRIVELLNRLGRSADFLGQATAGLSGGEIQIVALLRAVQLDPHVLLLDEPTAAIDSAAATAVEQLVGQWWAESPSERALVWVTHDPVQAERVAQRTLQMEAGRLTSSQT